MTKHIGLKILFLLMAVFTITLSLEWLGIRQHFTVEQLKELISNNLLIGTTIFIIAFAIGNIIQIPGWVFLATAVISTGKIIGGLTTYFAAVISCMLTYYLIGLLGSNTFRELKSPLANKIFRKLDQHPIACIAALRLIFQTMPALNYTLALSGIKTRHYLLGTLLGLPIPIFLYCLLFDYLAGYFLAQ